MSGAFVTPDMHKRFLSFFFFYEKVTGLIHLDDPGFIKDRVSVGSWREAMALRASDFGAVSELLGGA